MAKITIRDVARAAGVNASTVSRSLSGAYGVNDETRKSVLAAAAQLNYRPNLIARNLSTGRSHTLALIISDIRNPFFAEVARGAQDAASQRGYDLILCNADLDSGRQMQYIRSLNEKRVDGIIMNSVAALSPEELGELPGYDAPLVLLNQPVGAKGFSTIIADNLEGGRVVAEYLIRKGHRSLAHLTSTARQGNLATRTQGFLKEIADSGMKISCPILRGEQNQEGGFLMSKKIFAQHPNTTAIFAANDAIAFGVMRAAMDVGRRIPEDLSLIGFDNVDLALLLNLTTVHQPKYELGQAAVEMLLRGVSGDPDPEHRLLGVRLIERQSCRSA